MHSKHGEISVTLNSNGDSESDDETETNKAATYIHGLMMWIAWFIFGFVQVASNRWFIHLNKNLPNIHVLSGLFITGVTVFYVFHLINTFGMWYDHWHNLLGFIMFCSTGVVSLGGMATNFIKRSTVWNTRFILNMKWGHRILGFSIWAFGVIVCGFGLESYSHLWHDNRLDYLIWINSILMVSVFLICELSYRKLRSGEDPWVTNQLLKVMTEDQFD